MEYNSALLNSFSVQLHDIVRKKIGHQADCHDIMQEVYLKVLINLNKIKQADNISAYLVTLTNNAVVDHFRKTKTKAYIESPDDAAAEMQIEKDQSLQLADCCLRPMIESLPGIYRDALVKTELEEMKHKDYAKHAGISLSNAKIRVQRAKEKLKEIITRCCSYDFDKYGNIIDCHPSGCCKK